MKRRTDFAAAGPWPWVIISLIVAWSAVALNIWHDRTVTTADVTGDTANLARAFGENITRTVDAIDQSLLFVREAYRRDRDSLESLKGIFSGRILHGLQVQVAIADRKGDLVWSSLAGSANSHVNIADREHFRVQAAASADELYISTPVVGRLSDRRTIQFVRRLVTQAGDFDGVAVISIDAASLSRFYASISIGHGSVSLLRFDGTILAAAPLSELKVGNQIAASDRNDLFEGPVSGSYRHVSKFDGIERIYSYRRLSEYPLAVTVGESVEDTFADYERAFKLYLAGGGVLSLVAIGAGFFVHHQRRSLVHSRQALSATLENMSQGIIMVGADGAIATINRQALHLLGGPGSSQTGNQEALKWVRAHLGADKASGKPAHPDDVSESDNTIEREGPGATVLEVRTRRLRDHTAIITISDITSRKQNEAALAEAQTRAAHAERMQALGQLAGGIAHDFNNILQVAQGGAALIVKRSEAGSGAGRLARMIVDATERGTSITRRLLAFARRGELRAEPVAPAALAEGLREVLQHTLGSPITVLLRIQEDLPLVLADKGQLETALVNLATNARDAMPEGGTLTLAAAVETVMAGRAHPADLAPGRYVRFSVEDTGIGMDRVTLRRVLEPFFTTKPVGQGTGLGLPMAKGFAEQSGGALLIDSEPRRGTRVHLWLPGLGEDAAPNTAPPTRRRTVSSARDLLLVDDEPLVRETLTMALRDAGYSVTAASDASEALRLEASGLACEALVTDLSMPGMSGLELIQKMQARRPGLPAILLTGYAGQGAHLAVSDALHGSYVLMRKPVTAAQVTDQLEALLEGQRDDDLAAQDEAQLTKI